MMMMIKLYHNHIINVTMIMLTIMIITMIVRMMGRRRRSGVVGLHSPGRYGLLLKNEYFF